jgi:ribonucleoside-diphosphate reductase alpha chain
LTEERTEILQRIAQELMLAGQKTDTSLSEEQLTTLLDKALKALQPAEAEQLLLLGDQAISAVAQLRRPEVTEVRPQVLECDVVRFQNNKEKWVAFVGLLDGYPYEIFTGLQDDEEGIVLPKTVTKGKILKQMNPDGTKRYDFQFENKRGYKTTVEGLSEKFNKEYWNYAKLISGVLRYRMPLEHVIKLVGSLSLNDESINTWKVGVERALKKYIPGVHEDTDMDLGTEGAEL